MLKAVQDPVDILILGAGWTSTFLIPLIVADNRTSALPETPLTYAATATSSRPDALGRPTIPFRFDPASGSTDPYTRLPRARTVLITFPLTGKGQSQRLVELYRHVHGPDNRFIQLGSTGIFSAPHWNTHESPYDHDNARAIAEDELIAAGGVVLNLAGLYGGPRDPRDWVTRVAKTKDEVKGKKALHLVHGEDVARGILGVHFNWNRAIGVDENDTVLTRRHGKRWLLTDLRVYDWWDLIQTWGPKAAERYGARIGENVSNQLRYADWVGELMLDEGVRALPRSTEGLGRVLDSREFWSAVKVSPLKGRVTS